MNLDERYRSKLQQSSETDRLIYADIFYVNKK
jgi:hypothetical protein